MSIFKLTVYLTLCFNEVHSQTRRERISGVSGVSTNINIICLNNDGEITSPTVWMINGSVYGLLHVPNELLVCSSKSIESNCDLSTLEIPVVQSEMDGYTFQCVGIDYNTNTHHLGRQTELSVTTLPQDGSYNGIYTVTLLVHSIASLLIAVTLLDTVRRDVLELHYPELSVGPVNTSIGWTYSNLTCQPSVFTIEGYDPVPDHPYNFSTPFLTLTSTSCAHLPHEYHTSQHNSSFILLETVSP